MHSNIAIQSLLLSMLSLFTNAAPTTANTGVFLFRWTHAPSLCLTVDDGSDLLKLHACNYANKKQFFQMQPHPNASPPRLAVFWSEKRCFNKKRSELSTFPYASECNHQAKASFYYDEFFHITHLQRNNSCLTVSKSHQIINNKPLKQNDFEGRGFYGTEDNAVELGQCASDNQTPEQTHFTIEYMQ